MQKYKTPLEEYLNTTKIVTINEHFKIRLNEELFDEFNHHLYDKRIKLLENLIKNIISLNFKYPGNANPTFYLYIVPTSNFHKILNFPIYMKSGGRPVKCFDLDGFNKAYGITNNLLKKDHSITTEDEAGFIHELAHLVHSMFFEHKHFLGEGFADALTFYILDYENKIAEYLSILISLNEEDIFTGEELLNPKITNNFEGKTQIKHKLCSYEKTYISSYLFVRGCIEKLENIYKIDKVNATQKFLEMIWHSSCFNQYLIFYIADKLQLDKGKLLTGKTLQLQTLKNIKKPTLLK